MSVRSWLLLTATVVNLFSLEYSRPFFSMFIFVSYICLTLDLWGALRNDNKDIKTEPKVIDIEKVREELEKENKKETPS